MSEGRKMEREKLRKHRVQERKWEIDSEGKSRRNMYIHCT